MECEVDVFFRWTGHYQVDIVFLGGRHDEGGVININIDQEISSFTKVPMISPSFSGAQSFINHPQVVSYLRLEYAKFMEVQDDLFKLPKGS